MLLVLSLLLSIFLASLSLHILDQASLFEHSIFAKIATELFARLFLLWLILFLYVPLVLSKTVRNRFISAHWHGIMFILFAMGAATALGDPLHRVSEEFNWIRYWTAGVLVVAGVTALWSGLSSVRQLPERILGGVFGVLFITAAGDELFQFHELEGSRIEGYLPWESILSGQDTVTLGIAVLGVVVVMSCLLVTRYLPWAKAAFQEHRYRQAFSLFALAVFSFLTAMMLDSFDVYLEQLADQLRATILEHSGTTEVPRWLGINYMTQAANSLEELLEYLAALFILMMVGTLFSVKALGCDLSCKKEVRVSSNR